MAVLKDGHSTIITLGTTGAVKFYEKTVKPPGLQGGGGNSATTMRNTRWRTQFPKKLLTATEIDITASYDVEVFDDIPPELQKNQLITVTFENGDKVKFYGWLEEFVPNEHKEGEQPTANVKILVSNIHSTTGVETGPVYEVAA